jgi:hypothetical protein
MKSLGLDECKIWYIEFPSFKDKIHTVEFDDYIWGDIYSTILEVDKAIHNGEEPGFEPFAEWECDERYCPYYDICDRNEE